jgi:hypothetical protein
MSKKKLQGGVPNVVRRARTATKLAATTELDSKQRAALEPWIALVTSLVSSGALTSIADFLVQVAKSTREGEQLSPRAALALPGVGSLTPAQVKAKLQANCKRLPTMGSRTKTRAYGAGLLHI